MFNIGLAFDNEFSIRQMSLASVSVLYVNIFIKVFNATSPIVVGLSSAADIRRIFFHYPRPKICQISGFRIPRRISIRIFFQSYYPRPLRTVFRRRIIRAQLISGYPPIIGYPGGFRSSDIFGIRILRKLLLSRFRADNFD